MLNQKERNQVLALTPECGTQFAVRSIINGGLPRSDLLSWTPADTEGEVVPWNTFRFCHADARARAGEEVRINIG
jgi:hypothetical protein